MSPPKYPPFTLEDFTFVVATTADEADRGMDQLMTSAASSDNVFGFDIELTPTKAVRTIQVASRTHVIVFDIALIGCKGTYMRSISTHEHRFSVAHMSIELCGQPDLYEDRRRYSR